MVEIGISLQYGGTPYEPLTKQSQSACNNTTIELKTSVREAGAVEVVVVRGVELQIEGAAVCLNAAECRTREVVLCGQQKLR